MSVYLVLFVDIFFFKQKTAYEMRISDWSSDVCSSDLLSLSQKVPTAILILSRAYRLLPHLVGRVQTKLTISRYFVDSPSMFPQIGRASCRERVCQYV